MRHFGLIGPQTAIAIANIGINLHHQKKVNKMQKRFQRQLDRDAANIDYMRNIVVHFRNVGNRLLVVSDNEPGKSKFELALIKALSQDMNYKGNCETEIFRPVDAKDLFKSPIWARITRGGYVTAPGLPKDIGPIWATGCKNAQSEFRSNFIKNIKSSRKFTTLRQSKEAIATSDLISKFVAGALLILMMAVVIKFQLAKKKKKITP